MYEKLTLESVSEDSAQLSLGYISRGILEPTLNTISEAIRLHDISHFIDIENLFSRQNYNIETHFKILIVIFETEFEYLKTSIFGDDFSFQYLLDSVYPDQILAD